MIIFVDNLKTGKTKWYLFKDSIYLRLFPPHMFKRKFGAPRYVDSNGGRTDAL